MKITVETAPESQHMMAILALMDRIEFKEIERVVTGGHMSSVMLAITFAGDVEEFDKFKYLIYVSIRVPNYPTKYNFYSLTCLDGRQAETEEEFKDILEKDIMKEPEIKYFTPLFNPPTHKFNT